MAGNTFGKLFRLTTFGESHGTAIGGIIDGCPAGLVLDLAAIQEEVNRRKPGQSRLVSQRKEEEVPEFLSGIFKNTTTGTPIAFVIRNTDARPADYDHLQDVYRPSHADFTYQEKYGIRDHRGGGRSSARETACRVVAGAIARQMLSLRGIAINAFVLQAGTVKMDLPYAALDLSKTYTNAVRCPDPAFAEAMEAEIEAARKAGDTIGGIVQGVIRGCPAGLGEPVFDKFHAILGQAMLSINAVKGFEFGEGFNAVNFRGSEFNDLFVSDGNRIQTSTNRSGGIQGGITNGQDICFNVAFKPVATIMHPQQSVDSSGNTAVAEGRGRHDPCVLPRAVPIVEAMAALVTADMILQQQNTRI